MPPDPPSAVPVPAAAPAQPETPVVRPPAEHTDPADPAPVRRPLLEPAPEPDHQARPVGRPVEAAPTVEAAPQEPLGPPDPTVVVVEIGRIEVRLASEPVAAQRPSAVRPTPGPSLADYLRDRAADQGRPA
ncbi:MAG TPA: hypothetical protein VFJ89_00085 [Nocardioides sp.]|nr:hypothetical protein [Nocardioides sp.]